MEPKVLVIADADSTRVLVARMLSTSGFEVDGASSGSEAQELLAEAEYDVALIDLKMRDIDGFDVSSLEWMQIHAPNVVPIVLSDTAFVDEALKAVQNGAFDFVPKPIETPDIFLQQIQRAVNHKRLRDSRDVLLRDLQDKNAALESRLGQLEQEHKQLQAQALAIQIDLNRAMRIQQGLLPKQTPFSDRISFSALYRPMAKVGGDLYDLFQIDSHHVGLYVADASGHGVSSAMLTVFLKHAVQEVLCLEKNGRRKPPGVSLGELNQVMLNEALGQGVFVSMTYVVLNVDTLVLQYSSAGHPPLLIRREDGSIERFRRPAPVLGINPDVKYTDEEIALQPGDMFVLYTDGITEARDVSGDFFGEERLKRILRDAPGHSDDLTVSVDKELASFCEGCCRSDDATLLVLGAEPQHGAAATFLDEPASRVSNALMAGMKVLTARHDGCMFIALSGAGSWRESQQVLDLCEQARLAPERLILLDLGNCNHLDSTFMGMLHNIATSFDEDAYYRFEIQNVPRSVLREMSELGLTSVLMHFRPEPMPLPPHLRPVMGGVPSGDELSALLLKAHQALVDADERNADRFATVLKVLQERAKKKVRS